MKIFFYLKLFVLMIRASDELIKFKNFDKVKF